MRIVTSLLVLFAIFGASAAYADNFHVQNHSHTDVVATVYFNGKLETTLTLQPGQEYVHSFWHNLVVKVVFLNPKTKQTCSLGVAERDYESAPFTKDMYEPEVIEQTNNCRYLSSFDQDNWRTHNTLPEKFSTVDIWAPWL